MPKTKISEYSATANSNTDVASINIDEGCAPSGINNAIRAVMGHLKDFQSGTSNDPFTVGSSGSLTLSYGTANGVAYLNGSKVLTTGSALVFDGTNLGVGTSSPTGGANRVVDVYGSSSSAINFHNATSGTTATDGGLVGQYGSDLVLYNYEAGIIQFGTSNAERARIDSSGNLGIGTTSPTQKLHVAGKIAVSGTNPSIQQTVQNAYLDLCGGTTVGTDPSIQIAGSTTTSDANKVFYNSNTHVFRSSSGGTTYATIDSSGNLIVGSTNAQLQFNATTNNGNISVISSAANANLNIASKGAGSINLNATGGLYCTQVYSTAVGGTNRAVYTDNTGTIGYLSSVRASKTNIETLADVSWLMQLDSVQFNYRKRDIDGNYTEEFDSTIEYGLIAEEAEAVKQELCFYDEVDGSRVLRGVNYQKLVIPMLKAIQEQNQLIQSLTDRITTLEAK